MKGKKRLLKSIIAITMVGFLTIPLLATPITALAEEIETSVGDIPLEVPAETGSPVDVPLPEVSAPNEPENYYETDEPEGTLVDTSEYSRTWRTGKGKFTTETSAIRQAYKDKKGKLVAVDNTLEKKEPIFSADYYENAANAFTAKFPAEITDEKGVTVEKDGNRIEVVPLDGDFSRSNAVDNAIRYSEVMPGVDFQYTVIGDVIKEDIILNRYMENLTFEFEIKSNGLMCVQNENSVEVYREKGDSYEGIDPLFTVTAPVMEDACGIASTKVSLTLEQKDGKSIVTLIPDEEWLKDNNRAYPVRVDPTIVTVGLSRFTLMGVEEGSPNSFISDNGYPYAGYDDGIRSGNLANPQTQTKLLTCRTYVGLDYRFLKVPKEARIEAATFYLHQRTAWSGGNTLFSVSAVKDPWPGRLTWNTQISMGHEFVSAASSLPSQGYISWNVEGAVNSWVQELIPNYGLVVKAVNENDQCEVFSNKDSAFPPVLQVTWSIPDPVDTDMDINNLTTNLRPISEQDIQGKLQFDGVFSDGEAKPGSTVAYKLLPDMPEDNAFADFKYRYPDSTDFVQYFPNGTRYLDKRSNWQTGLYSGLALDKAYRFWAKATYYDEDTDATSVSEEKLSEKFLVYKIKRKDTFPYIANYYGVPVATIMRDNRVQDALVIEDNTIFIRNPQTEVPYNPPPLTEQQMRDIDRGLNGRCKHCEYGFEPVNLNTGNFLMEQTDAAIAEIEGDFKIERTYNSRGENYQSVFGRRWSFTYSESLSKLSDGRIAYYVGDGKTLFFEPDGTGGYVSPAGYFYDLEVIPYQADGVTYHRYEIREKTGACRRFNAFGLLTDIVNPDGLTTAIVYDENYNIKEIVSPTGKKYLVAEDSLGRISQVTRPDGNSLNYEYDINGNLIKYTDARGGSIRYEYDSSGLMTAAHDQNGNRFVKNIYDNKGRVIEQYDAKNGKTTFSYTENTTTTVDANGNVTVYTYDNFMRTIKIEYPDGEVIERGYGQDNTLAFDENLSYTDDGKGNVTSEKRADGAVKYYEYNEKSFLTKVTDYDGTAEIFDYDARGDLANITRADGKSEKYTYDEYHRVTSHTDVGGGVTHFTYSGAVLATQTDPNGNIYTFGYDAMNRQVSEANPVGGIKRIMYDASGNVVGEQAEDGAYTSYAFDAAGNAVSVTDARGYTTQMTLDVVYNITKGVDAKGVSLTYTYDANGNTLTQTDAKGNVTKYAYDSRNRLIKETDSAGAVTVYTYDTKGRQIEEVSPSGAVTKTAYDDSLNLPIRATDGLGHITSYEYDAVGRLVKMINPDGTYLSYEYDAVGNPITIRDADGKVSKLTYSGNDNVADVVQNEIRRQYFEYDKVGNAVKSIDPLGGIASFVYDGANRLIAETDVRGQRSVYEYDEVGRLTKSINPLGHEQGMAYDALGNITKIIDANGNETNYVYDEIGKLVSVIDAKGSITNYSYDETENLTKISDALGGVTQYEYNAVRQPISVSDANGNISKLSYDISGNLSEMILPTGDAAKMVYDEVDRLIKETDPYGVVSEYTYDSMGRTTYEKNSAGDVLRYTYDILGRLSKITDEMGREELRSYDSFSQVIELKDVNNTKTKYTYNLLGRAIRETYANGSSAEAAYDAAGNLISKRVPTGGLFSYTYDGAGRLTSIKDPLANTTKYEYDPANNVIAEVDAKGIKSEYSYDPLGNPIQTKSGRGAISSYSYDALGRLILSVSPEGGRNEYSYDKVGKLLKAKDPEGGITEYIYDVLGNMTKEISAREAERLYKYDKHGYVTEMTDPLGNVTRYDVLPNGLTKSITRANGGKYQYGYDEAERIICVKSPLGLERKLSYDVNGDLISETDNIGRTSNYSYDVMHNLVQTENPAGMKTSFDYDAGGNLISKQNPNGGVTSYEYDLLDRLKVLTDPLGKKTTQSYDETSNVLSVTKEGERKHTYGYDEDGNLISVIDPLGFKESLMVDKEGRMTERTDAMGSSERFSYDKSGRLTKRTDSKGIAILIGYDEDGNITKITNQLGGRLQYGYDMAGNLTSVKDPMGRITSHGYDEMGNLTRTEDADGKITAYTYDLEGNMISVRDPAGDIKKMEYDVSGRLSKMINKDGSSIKYDYDKLNLLVSKEYSEDKKENVIYAYDNMGERIKMTDSSGTSRYEYDPLGRITKVTNADGKSVLYEYNEADLLSKLTYADKSAVSYTYDKNDRLVSVTDKAGETKYYHDALGRIIGTYRPGGLRTNYSYDENGDLVQIDNMSKKGSVISSFAYEYDAKGNIITERAKDKNTNAVRSFEYNGADELVSFIEKDGKSVIKYDYAYDNSGNRVSQTKVGTGGREVISYEYDKANKLIKEKSSKTGTKDCRYDANGNLISKRGGGDNYRYEYSIENRLKAVRTGGTLLMAAAYDGDGNRTFRISRRWMTWDTPKGGEEEIYSGNDKNKEPEAKNRSFAERLRNVFCYSFFGELHAEAQGITATNIKLDSGIGNRVDTFWDKAAADDIYSDEDIDDTKTLLPGDGDILIPDGFVEESGYGYETTRYVNDVNTENTQVLMEYGTGGSLRAKYTYGNERISMQNAGGSSIGSGTNYYTYDGRGSVSEVVSSSGSVRADYSYGAFGEVLGGAGKEASAYAYNGEEYNPLTKLSYMRARYYDAEAGRFGVEDSYLGNIADPLSLNRYTYTKNNPINNQDPSGHKSVPVTKALSLTGLLAGLAVGAGAGNKRPLSPEDVEKLISYQLEILRLEALKKKRPQDFSLAVQIDNLKKKQQQICESYEYLAPLMPSKPNANPKYTPKPGAGVTGPGIGAGVGKDASDKMSDEGRYNRVNSFATNKNVEQYKKEFVLKIYKIGLDIEKKYGIPAAIFAAQSILEVGYGVASPKDDDSGKISNNYFNIKGSGPNGSVTMKVPEFINGQWVTSKETFAAYNSFEESAFAYANLINGRYTKYLKGDSINDWISAIVDGGYATDPNYGQKMRDVISSWRLE